MLQITAQRPIRKEITK